MTNGNQMDNSTGDPGQDKNDGLAFPWNAPCLSVVEGARSIVPGGGTSNPDLETWNGIELLKISLVHVW